MTKLCFSDSSGTLYILLPAAKADMERMLGPISNEEYHARLLGSVNTFMELHNLGEPINVRALADEDLPTDRTYRQAWCDVTPDSKINLNVEKVKDISLNNLRAERQKKFEELGVPVKLAPAVEALLDQDLRDKLQALRDVTEPLKAVNAKNKIDDEATIDQIKNLSKKEVLDEAVSKK